MINTGHNQVATGIEDIGLTPKQAAAPHAETASSRARLCNLEARVIARDVREGLISPVEVIEAVLWRQAEFDSELHAFCTPMSELALDTARRLEADVACGRNVGPLAGVPVAIKDLIWTKGTRTTGGSRPYADFVPDEDDIAVERLKAAGAIILGKTNVAELGYGGVGHNPLFATTRNPWARDLTSGGSSAGSAVAVATGMAPVALGSDGGGSIRVPAALCGVVGFKPSMGRVPLYPGCRDERYPGLSGWESIEHLGPLCRTVADVALVMSVIAGPDFRDRLSLPAGDIDWSALPRGDIAGSRVAYSADWGYALVDSEIREIVQRAVQIFEGELGCRVEQADPGFDDPAEAFQALVALETDLTGMTRLIESREQAFSPHIVEMVQRSWKATEFTDAIMTRKRVTNAMWRFMSRFDLLLTPTVAAPAFQLGIEGPATIEGASVRPQAWNPFTFVMNLTGQPAISVPAGRTRAGLPVGLHICGRHLCDEMVLRAAAAFESASPWIDADGNWL